MKLYIRELPQQKYHYQQYDIILPKNMTPKPGDTLQSHWSDYHIDRVTYSNGGLIVYVSKTRLQKYRSNTCYRKKKN